MGDFHFLRNCTGLYNPIMLVPVLLPGESHGWRSLVGCSPWGCREADTTGRLHFRFPLSCIGEGNGNPLQYSCLENPRDGGVWWAPVCGVAQSWTQLKRLSSSSSNMLVQDFCLFSTHRTLLVLLLIRFFFFPSPHETILGNALGVLQCNSTLTLST